MKFESFEQAVKYLETFSNLDITNSKIRSCRLDRMRAIMHKLGDPQNCYKTIHIAGSKGKGSTASYIASGLQAMGFKTGLYMSPHVTDVRERFTLCKTFFENDFLIETANILYEKLQDFKYADDLGESQPTTFELYTAFAFLLFKRANCDWAVIETGLGGKLDATNILNPEAVVLTPVELEHTEILGNTIAEIASEKSKIIKHDKPVFISLQETDALNVFLKEAAINKCSVYSISQDIINIRTETYPEYQKLDIEFPDSSHESFNLKMLGNVQAYNCALAVLLLKTLGLYDRKKCISSIENNILPARMEVIKKERIFYIDGAHTKASVEKLLSIFRVMYPGQNGLCIFSCISGKKYQWMSDIILEAFDKIVISKPGFFKSSNPSEIYNYMMSRKTNDKFIELIEDSHDAVKYSIENTDVNEPILVCGSFYLAGVIKEVLCH